MSATLYWRAVKPHRSKALPDDIRWALVRRGKRMVGDNGRGPWRFSTECPEDVAYLRGLADAGIRGSADLCAALEKHGCIELELRF